MWINTKLTFNLNIQSFTPIDIKIKNSIFKNNKLMINQFRIFKKKKILYQVQILYEKHKFLKIKIAKINKKIKKNKI